MGPALGCGVHLCGYNVYDGDGGRHEVQGIYLSCRLWLDVLVCGHKWPLLSGVVVRQDGLCVVCFQGLQLGGDADVH